MKRYEKETAQAFLDNEKEVLKSLDEAYADALEKIDERIANLLGRADADMQHVVYQVEYQRMLKGQVESILRSLQTEEFETVSEYLTHCYEDGFIGSLYSLQQQGVPLAFPIDQEQVAAAIRHETNLSTTLYAAFDISDLQKKIANEISRGFAASSSFAEIARNVANQAKISRNNAMRIVRTEGHRITETAAYHAQKKAQDRGADIVKIWDAALDHRTRPSHARLDGEIRELDEPFSNGLMYPGDRNGAAKEVINCRCRSRSDSRWLLEADETKMLGDVSKMSQQQREAIAEKLGIPVDELEQYSRQIVPVRAKSYDDFKRQYNQLWHYEGSDVQRSADARIRNYRENTQISKNSLDNSGNSSTIKLPDVMVAKSLGAKAKNYNVMDLATGEMFHFVEGTRIQNVEVFAGKGARKAYENAYKYADRHGGAVEDWQHVKGTGWLETDDGDRHAEVHWSQCEGIGKHDFFVKRWLDD